MYNEFDGFIPDQPIYNVFIAGDAVQLAAPDDGNILENRLMSVPGVHLLGPFSGAITFEDYWFALPHPRDVALTLQGQNLRLGHLTDQVNILPFLACHRLIPGEAYPHLVLFVVEAAHGLTPDAREQLRYIAVSGYDRVVVFLQGAHRVDAEVLALVRDEVDTALEVLQLDANILCDSGDAADLWAVITSADEGANSPELILAPAKKLSGLLYVSKSLTKQHIGHNTQIKLVYGDETVYARVKLENQEVLGRGESGWATLTLYNPLPAARGQGITVKLVDFPPRRDSICFFRVERVLDS